MLPLLPYLTAFRPAQIPLYKRPEIAIDRRVADLVQRMTPEEKARQLDMYAGTAFVSAKLDDTHVNPDAKIVESALASNLGSLGAGSIHDLYPTADVYNQIQHWVIGHNRLGIPAIFIEEGVHGFLGFGDTVYPCSINLASTFDTSLAKLTGSQIASEARATGVDMILGPVLDVAREPRWGRIEEDFGEDPYLSGELGAHYVQGMQGSSLNSDHTVVSEPKHFAGHGSPDGGTNTSPVHAGEREFRSIFLRSFQPAFERSGARGVMAAYHEVDGVPSAGNSWLLNHVLREEWGFKGFVLSDLGAISMLYSAHHVAATPGDAVRLAIRSGVDMQFYDFSHDVFQSALVQGVKDHTLDPRDLDRAVSHVLRVKFELGLFDRPYVDPNLHPKVSRESDHLATSLQSSLESLCLLKNANGLLPLNPQIGSVAVIGPNAVVGRTGDYTATYHFKPDSIASGIQLIASHSKVYTDDGSNIERAVEVAKSADVVVMGLGEREGISGEGSDRTNLSLPDKQEELLEAIVATGKRVVLVLENGRPLSLPWAAEHVPAIMEAWYPGEFGGKAIAETLFGLHNPSGHLPISFPTTVGAIPVYYNHDPSKNMRYVDGTGKPLWPFGFGLSYTTFKYANLKVKPEGSRFLVTADVTNTGKVAGEDVAQLYEHIQTGSVATAERALKGFQRIQLAPGETKSISFTLGKYELEIWGSEHKWSVEPGRYHLWVGSSSDADLGTTFTVGPKDSVN